MEKPAIKRYLVNIFFKIYLLSLELKIDMRKKHIYFLYYLNFYFLTAS